MVSHGESKAQFFQTFSLELDAQADRVRQLIGDRHWLSDGHHKEALLRGLLRRHLPCSVSATRGFVIGHGRPNECSKEQDILILDVAAEAPIFSYDELTVTFSDHVIGSISVKTQFRKEEFENAVKGLCSVATLCVYNDPLPWLGIYFFNLEPSLKNNDVCSITNKCAEWFRELTNESRIVFPDGIDWCFRISRDLIARVEFKEGKGIVSGARCEAVSSALFTALLIDTIADAKARKRSAFADIIDTEYEAIEHHKINI